VCGFQVFILFSREINLWRLLVVKTYLILLKITRHKMKQNNNKILPHHHLMAQIDNTD